MRAVQPRMARTGTHGAASDLSQVQVGVLGSAEEAECPALREKNWIPSGGACYVCALGGTAPTRPPRQKPIGHLGFLVRVPGVTTRAGGVFAHAPAHSVFGRRRQAVSA